MDEQKLRNCPFCGDNQQLNYVELSNGLHYIECARCGAAPHRLGAWNRETAVKYWNSVNRWIPCSERLPEDGQRVLICSKSKRLFDVFFRANAQMPSFDTKIFGKVYAWYCEDVIKWMPLPELPKGEQK